MRDSVLGFQKSPPGGGVFWFRPGPGLACLLATMNASRSSIFDARTPDQWFEAATSMLDESDFAERDRDQRSLLARLKSAVHFAINGWLVSFPHDWGASPISRLAWFARSEEVPLSIRQAALLVEQARMNAPQLVQIGGTNTGPQAWISAARAVVGFCSASDPQRAPEEASDQAAGPKIALIFDTETGHTNQVGCAISRSFPEGVVEIYNAAEISHELVEKYDFFIVGTPSSGQGKLADNWQIFLESDGLDFSGKTVAVYGLGDQVGYPDDFCSGMGALHARLVELGARSVGAWPAEGYSFRSSTALVNKSFVGLAIDQDNQAELTAPRIASWTSQLASELSGFDQFSAPRSK